jgi:hypothetical protein
MRVIFTDIPEAELVCVIVLQPALIVLVRLLDTCQF